MKLTKYFPLSHGKKKPFPGRKGWQNSGFSPTHLPEILSAGISTMPSKQLVAVASPGQSLRHSG
jgi:hypothetical protein